MFRIWSKVDFYITPKLYLIFNGFYVECILQQIKLQVMWIQITYIFVYVQKQKCISNIKDTTTRHSTPVGFYTHTNFNLINQPKTCNSHHFPTNKNYANFNCFNVGKANKFVYLNHLFLFQRNGHKLDHKTRKLPATAPVGFFYTRNLPQFIYKMPFVRKVDSVPYMLIALWLCALF